MINSNDLAMTLDGRSGERKENTMYHYEYVSRNAAKPYREEFETIIYEVQDLLRDEFTFQYDFIGSSSRNMITCDFTTNIGFDFDVNLHIDGADDYSPEDLKKVIMRMIDRVAVPRGYANCEDSTRVITLKMKNQFRSRIEYSCDFAIVNDYEDDKGRKHQEYIHFQKNQRRYYWNEQPKGYDLELKVDWIKKQPGNLWDDVLDLYLDKKNNNTNPDKKSRALYAETINEICQQSGYYD